MKPCVITLPDSIRDRLEAALDFDEDERGEARVSAYEQIVGDIMLPLRPAPAEKDFLGDFQEKMLGLSCGNAAPAIMLRNLPRGETGKHFVLGLNDLLGAGKRYEQPIHKTGAQPMHKDGKYDPDIPTKWLAMLYCEKAGYPTVPTTMTTADELLDHWAGLAAGKGPYRDQSPDQTKQTLITRLQTAICSVPRSDGTAQRLPLLLDNPNYTPGSDAPRYMLSIDPRRIRQYIPNGHGVALERELTTALNSLRNTLSRDSTISVEDNTVTFYNDPLVMHARGMAQQVVEPDSEQQRIPRLVHAYDIMHSVALGENEEYTPQINATGGPVSHVSFIEHDGPETLHEHHR